MAWAEKLQSGKYRGVYRDAAGKRRSVGTYTHKARAEREAAAKEVDMRKRSWRDPEAYKRTWGDWADDWEATRAVALSTAKRDLNRRKHNLDPYWSDVAIGSITRQDVKAWAATLSRGKAGPETVKRCVHLLSASLAAAVDAEVIDVNPAARIKLPGGAPAGERFLTHTEYDKIREQLPTEYDQLIADVLVGTGMRWGEMAGLHWSRVDSERPMLRVIETFDESSSTMKPYPKGRRSRVVPIAPDLISAMAATVGHEKTCGVPHGTGRCQGPLALTTRTGCALRNSNWASNVWVPAVEASGVGHTRIHDLRHTYASWLLQAGVSLAEVGRLLGHVSPLTTARYAHLAETPTDEILLALAAPRKPHGELEK